MQILSSTLYMNSIVFHQRMLCINLNDSNISKLKTNTMGKFIRIIFLTNPYNAQGFNMKTEINLLKMY